jgi:hypothetical protein
MGGKYRITGTQYPRMRRTRSRGRIVASTVAVTVALSLAGWGTLQLIDVFGGGRGGSTKANAAPAACKRSTPSATASAVKAGSSPAPSSAPSTAAALPKPGAITVNVYNATSKSGLAKTTADALAARGFKIGTFGNAPAEYDKKVTQSALLVGGAKAGPAIRALSAQIAGTATKTDPKLSGTTVELMIGKAFTKLSSDAQVKQALTALAHPSPESGSTGKNC